MATLKLSIKEELVLNGKDRGSENVTSVTGVTQVDHRIITATTTAQTLLLFGTTDAAGQIKDATVKHLRITNLDTTNFVMLRFVDTAVGSQFWHKLAAGDSFISGNSLMYGDATGTAVAATGSFVAMDEIHVDADGASCQLEVFVAT